MAVTLPSIDIEFRQLAGTLIQRSERGIAILIVRDVTSIEKTAKYTDIAQVQENREKYTADTLRAIEDAMKWGVYQLIVIRIGEDEAIGTGLSLLEKTVKTGWVTIAAGTEQDHNALAAWCKAKEGQKKSYKALCYQATVTDCMHIVNFYNESVIFNDDRGEQRGAAYCPSLLGILAAANISKGVTYHTCTDLLSVEEMEDNNAAVEAGKLILINDVDGVLIGVGINSLTTLNGSTATEDMRYIETVEAMDLIRDDITATFKKSYMGKYRNKYQNQILFISAVNGYFGELERIDVLDDAYDNRADVDVEAQRAAWIASGKAEAIEWSEAQVRNNTYKQNLFLAGDVKILGSMTNLRLDISMM